MKNKKLIFLGMATTSIFAASVALSSSCLRKTNQDEPIEKNTEILLTKSSSTILPSEITKNDIKANIGTNSKIKNIEIKADDKTGTLTVTLTVEANGKEAKITKTFTNFKKQEQSQPNPSNPGKPENPNKPIEDEPTEPEKPGTGEDEEDPKDDPDFGGEDEPGEEDPEDPQNPGGEEEPEDPKPNNPGTGNNGGEDEEDPEKPGTENPGQPGTPGNEEQPEQPGNPQPEQPITDTSLKGLAKIGKLFVVTYNDELADAVKEIKEKYATKSYVIVDKKGIKYGSKADEARKAVLKTFVKINEKATGNIKDIIVDKAKGNRKALQFSIENGKVVIKFKIAGDNTVYTVALEK
ncbi:lipoprotein 17-related variable surface protein [Mycoplasmopsis hyopharyngis]|uniref:lipoprotein 17-related variable surface protein n=1 Tax=Mycoplasmopsis hyopharyngis TaxID=29558 RepID=UPI0038738D9E